MKAIRACQGETKEGEPCRAPCLPGKSWCLFHDPEKAEELTAARRLGGQSRTVVMDYGPEHFVKYARRCMREVREGKLSPQQGSAIASLGNMALKAQAQMETDKRVDELDERTAVLRNLTPEQLLKFVERGAEDDA